MEREFWTGGEIEVDVFGFFATHHHMQMMKGTLGEFTFPAFGTSGVFRFDSGRELVVGRTSWWRGWHELRGNGIVLGTARPRGFWWHTLDVGFRGQMYELAPASFWSRGWHLVDGTGVILVEVWPRGFFRRGAQLVVKRAVHTDLLVFTYYLVNARWQEQAAAGGAAAAGS